MLMVPMHQLVKISNNKRIRTAPSLFCPLMFGILLFLLLFGPTVGQAAMEPAFEPVVAKLTRFGFDSPWLQQVFSQPCIKLDPNVLTLRLTIRESKINYGQFLEDRWLNECRTFMKTHEEALNRAVKDHGVPSEVVVAILLLETKLGGYTGKFQTVSTLATHAAAGQPGVASDVYNRLPQEEKRRWTLDTAAQRLANRKDWSFNELKAFLQFVRQTGVDPCALYGSYTGAIGLSQFQPSNIKPYGRDGNQDGRVDLFQVEDAIHSTAYYLSRHGWRQDMNQSQKIKVIRSYNNSTPYAQTVLEVAGRIKP